jgi:hypothetical protein
MDHNLKPEWADIADKAADEISIRGWCQGEEIDADGKVCMRGGLLAALNVEIEAGVVPLFSAIQSFDNLDASLEDALTEFTITEAGCLHSGIDEYVEWNDAKYRLKDEVIDMLRRFGKHVREKTIQEKN